MPRDRRLIAIILMAFAILVSACGGGLSGDDLAPLEARIAVLEAEVAQTPGPVESGDTDARDGNDVPVLKDKIEMLEAQIELLMLDLAQRDSSAAADRNEVNAETIEVREIRLVDASGDLRAVLGTDDDGRPALTFLRPDGQVAVFLGIEDSLLGDVRDTAALSFSDSEGRVRARLLLVETAGDEVLADSLEVSLDLFGGDGSWFHAGALSSDELGPYAGLSLSVPSVDGSGARASMFVSGTSADLFLTAQGPDDAIAHIGADQSQASISLDDPRVGFVRIPCDGARPEVCPLGR